MDLDRRFDERLFDRQLGSLRERSRVTAKRRVQELRYTVFVLRILWAAVIVPFLAGAACAFLLVR